MKPIKLLGRAVVFTGLLIISTSSFSQDPNLYIYLCFGQSNMEGQGAIETQDQTVDSRFQVIESMDCSNLGRTKGNAYTAVPPLCRCNTKLCPADYFGRTMVANLPSNIKVAVVVIGIAGCDIALFGKTGYSGYDTYNIVPSTYGGSAYAWLLDIAKTAKTKGVIKGILLHQGETNSGQSTWPAKVKAVYDNLITDLGLDATKTPFEVGEMLYQNQGGACYGHNSIIATIPGVIPNSYVISASGCPGQDTYHFNSAGYRTLGTRYAMQMLALMEPFVSISSPVTNTTYNAPASISITADVKNPNPNGTITKVDFYSGTTKIGTSTTSPYSFTWTNVAKGTYSITAVATNSNNKTGTSPAITVVVNGATNLAPTVSLTSPANEATFPAPANVTIDASAADGDGTISKVSFYNGTTLLGEDAAAPYSFDMTNLAAGTYVITAVATDNLNATTTSSAVTFTVTLAPKVNLVKGWNCVGCPIQGSTDVGKALSSIWQSVETVKDQDNFYSVDNPSVDFNSLKTVDWGKGYLVKVTRACELDWIVK